MRRLLWPSVALALVIAYPLLFSTPFQQRLGALVLLYAIAASAWNIVGGYAGQVSVGHVVFFGCGAYAAMGVYAHFALSPLVGIPVGIVVSVAIAAATGASFVREIFTGLFASDMGLWQADCAGALRLRHSLGRDDLKLLFNINAEFAHSLDERPIALRAKSAVFSSLADAILVSGPLTGDPVDRSNLKTVRDAVPDVPVLANTGVTIDNVRDILAIADGVVIGTHFKVDGNTWNPVDGARVKRFMDAVAKLR